MAKFYGEIGYVTSVEKRPGVFVEEPSEYKYVGDIIRSNSRWESSGGVNEDITFNNRISIVADSFAYEHFSQIRYAVINGMPWVVTQIEVSAPRLILSIGGVYNGKRPTGTP